MEDRPMSKHSSLRTLAAAAALAGVALSFAGPASAACSPSDKSCKSGVTIPQGGATSTKANGEPPDLTSNGTQLEGMPAQGTAVDFRSLTIEGVSPPVLFRKAGGPG
jgi:hypothetical protein